MKKSDLIADLATRANLTKTQAADVLKVLPSIAQDQLAQGLPFEITGLVKITLQDRAARMGRNPATGEAIQIAAKRAVKASPAKALKDAV